MADAGHRAASWWAQSVGDNRACLTADLGVVQRGVGEGAWCNPQWTFPDKGYS